MRTLPVFVRDYCSEKVDYCFAPPLSLNLNLSFPVRCTAGPETSILHFRKLVPRPPVLRVVGVSVLFFGNVQRARGECIYITAASFAPETGSAGASAGITAAAFSARTAAAEAPATVTVALLGSAEATQGLAGQLVVFPSGIAIIKSAALMLAIFVGAAAAARIPIRLPAGSPAPTQFTCR